MSKLRWVAVSILVLFAVPTFAQKITGTIRGTVTDPSSAVVANAKVTIKNEDTGVSRTITSNSVGGFVFAELVVGSYEVAVESPGFKRTVKTKIPLSVAETRGVDVQLEKGEIVETISVESNAQQVKLIGADVSGSIAGDAVRELPLNGRNFIQLTLLMPGVTTNDGFDTKSKGLQGGSDTSVSGGSTTSNMWMVDGANNNDVGSNRTILVYPSVDAIEEFKIQRNNYGAEFGQAGGAQVNLVTRGGTNDFHGSAYFYARRDKFNENNYFLKQAGQQKPALKWDDYGATLGGPVIKDKLHFFLSEEINKDARTSARSGFVPTALQRQGNFTEPGIPNCTPSVPNDPFTGQPFPGNIIPADRLSAGGLLMAQLYSLPNTTPTGGSCNNWVQAVDAPVDWRQDHARVDYSISDNTRLMVRYTQDHWKAANTNLWGDDPFPVVSSNWEQPGRSLVAQLNNNIGSQMVNSLTFSYSANKITATRAGDNPGLVEQINAAFPTQFPASNKTGSDQPLNWGQGPYGSGGLWNQAPWVNNQNLYVAKDDFSAVFGKHFFKAGLLFSTNQKNEQPDNASQEGPQFCCTPAGVVDSNGVYHSGVNSGNAFADLLIKGSVWGMGEVKTNKSVLVRWQDLEGYLADSWKVDPRVTVDLGVRVSHLTMPFMADDQFGGFDPSTIDNSLRGVANSGCNGMIYPPGTNPCTALGILGGSLSQYRGVAPTKSLLIAPRVGIAWDVFGTGKTAIGAGVGQFYNRERVSPALGMGLNIPFSATGSINRTIDSNAAVFGTPIAGFGAPGPGREQVAANPFNWQWNMAVQQELAKNTTLELAYVGSHGGDLTGNFDVNQVAPENRVAYARTGNSQLRPYGWLLGDGSIAMWTHSRTSSYNALQAQLLSRFGHGSQIQVSYTFSKMTSDEPMNDADSGLSANETLSDNGNPSLEKGPAMIDRRHMVNGSLILALPTLQDKDAFLKNVFGDWEFTSIVSAGSGTPITVFQGGVPGIQGAGGTPAGTGYGNPVRPNLVAGQSCLASGGSEVQWLNPQAWTVTGMSLGQLGNSPRGVCDGPGYFTVDMALYKNIRLGDRVRLQLRIEGFNILNRNNFVNPGNFTWTPQNVTFDTPNIANASTITASQSTGGFGQLNAVRDPRQMQIGVRLSF